MALALDASSPALINSGYLGVSPATYASNSFSPPANSVIEVTVLGATTYGPAAFASASVTDSLTSHLSWQAGPSSTAATPSTNNSPGAWVFWAVVGSTAPGSMTVSATLTASGGQNVYMVVIAVKVWTGAKASGPIGASATGQYSGQNLSISLTPQAAGSALLMAVADGAASGSISAGSGAYVCDTALAYSVGQVWVGTSGGPTLTPSTSPETVAMVMGTSSAISNYVAFEVLAAGGGSTYPGIGSVAGTFSATATGTVILPGSAAVAGTFSASAQALVTVPAQGTVTVSFTALAAGSSGVATYPGTGAVVASFTATAHALMNLPGTGAVAGTFVGSANAVATLFARGTLTASFTATAAVPLVVYTFTPPTLDDTPAIAFYDRAMRADGTVTSEWRVDRANPLGFRLFSWFKQRPQGVAVYKMSDGTWRSDRVIPGITTQVAWPPVPIDQQVNGAINQAWYAGKMVNDYVQEPAVVTVYYGGTTYQVSQAEAADLIAGGFGAYVTSEASPS